MTLADIVILLVVLVSAAVGFFRGGAREVVTLVAMLVSILAAAFALPLTGPLFRHFINPAWVGTVAALVIVFVAVYLGVHALGRAVSEKMRQADGLGGVDRFVGLSVGVVRGLVVIGILHLFLAAFTPANRTPGWFRHAALFPVSAAAAKMIQAVLPAGAKLADQVAPKVEASVRQGASDKPIKPAQATSRPQSPPKRGHAYDQHQRAKLDALVEKSR